MYVNGRANCPRKAVEAPAPSFLDKVNLLFRTDVPERVVYSDIPAAISFPILPAFDMGNEHRYSTKSLSYGSFRLAIFKRL